MSRPMKQEPNRPKWGIPSLQGGEEVKPDPKPRLAIDDQMVSWLADGAGAARALGRFYRRMGDGPQFTRAEKCGREMADYMQRRGEGVPSAEGLAQELGLDGGDALAEDRAWQIVLRGILGVLVCMVLADDPSAPPPPASAFPSQGIKGRFNRILNEALRGYDTAFPEAMARDGARATCTRVAEEVATSLVTSVAQAPNFDPQEREASREAAQILLKTVMEDLHEALMAFWDRRSAGRK